MRYPFMPFGAFVAAVLVLVPLPSLWKARSSTFAPLYMSAWLAVLNIIYGINSLVWADNDEIHIPVWCDITTKLVVGSLTAIPAAALCICQHLKLVASSHAVPVGTEPDAVHRTRLRKIREGVLCIGVPVLFMILHFTIQGRRFSIIENFGCQPTASVSIPAIFILWVPPLLLSALCLVYAVLVFQHFFSRRLSFDFNISSGHNSSGIMFTARGRLRLMSMAVTQVAWSICCNGLAIHSSFSPNPRADMRYHGTGAGSSRVESYTLNDLSPTLLREITFLWWSIPISGALLFLYLVFGKEVKEDYRQIWRCITSGKNRHNAPLDLWPDAHGGTRRIVIHKFSTVELTRDDVILPSYFQTSSSTLNVPTSTKAHTLTDDPHLETRNPTIPSQHQHYHTPMSRSTSPVESWHSAKTTAGVSAISIVDGYPALC